MSNLQFIATFSLMMFTIAWLSGCELADRKDTETLDIRVEMKSEDCHMIMQGGELTEGTGSQKKVTPPK